MLLSFPHLAITATKDERTRQKNGGKFSVILKITRATMSERRQQQRIFLLEIIIRREANDDDEEEERERKILCAWVHFDLSEQTSVWWQKGGNMQKPIQSSHKFHIFHLTLLLSGVKMGGEKMETERWTFPHYIIFFSEFEHRSEGVGCRK